MLYNNIFSYVKPRNFVMRNTIQDLTGMPKDNLEDAIKLYIEVVRILKGEGYSSFGSKQVTKKDITGMEDKKFDGDKFNMEFLSKGSLLNNNRLIAMNCISKAGLDLEEYLESILIDSNPQLDIFRDFIEGNFADMQYVFKKAAYIDSLYISYENKEGDLIEIKNKEETRKYGKEELSDMLINSGLPTKVFTALGEIADINFNKYKKLLLNAMELQTKGINVSEDGLFMRTFNGEVKELKGVRKKKQDAQDKLNADKAAQAERDRINKERTQGANTTNK